MQESDLFAAMLTVCQAEAARRGDVLPLGEGARSTPVDLQEATAAHSHARPRQSLAGLFGQRSARSRAGSEERSDGSGNASAMEIDHASEFDQNEDEEEDDPDMSKGPDGMLKMGTAQSDGNSTTGGKLATPDMHNK